MNAHQQQRLRSATQDCLDAIMQLRRVSEADLYPEHLHSRLQSMIDRMSNKLMSTGFGKKETEDVKYAIVALIDEVAVGLSGEVSYFWQENLLQMHYFNENVAGEGFFDRLDMLRRDGQRIDILEVYYICLMLGFKGRYAIRGGDFELEEIGRSVRETLSRAGLREPDALSPHAERPVEAVSEEKKRIWLLAFPVGAVVVSLGIYLALNLSVRAEIESTIETIQTSLTTTAG